MKKQMICVAAVMMSLALIGRTFAAASPVRLTVTKSEDKEYKTKKGEAKHPRVAASRLRETGETVTYAIEAVNVGGQPLTKMEIHWAVLVNHPGDPLRVEKGKQTCDMKPGEKFSFEAGPIEIRTHGGKIDGYCVEALVDGKVVASDIQPANTKQRVEALGDKRPDQAK